MPSVFTENISPFPAAWYNVELVSVRDERKKVFNYVRDGFDDAGPGCGRFH